MLKYHIIIIILHYSIIGISQTNAEIEINKIADTVEKYHIGYHYHFAKSEAYKNFKKNIFKKILADKTVPIAFSISEYLNYYNDNHFFYYTTDSLVPIFKSKHQADSDKNLVGLWQDMYSEKMYKVANKGNGDMCFVQIGGRDSIKLVRYSNTGLATIFDFKKRSYITGFQINKGIIYQQGKPFLKRINDKKVVYKKQVVVFDGFSNKKISDSIYLLRIGTLQRSYTKTYDSVINSIHNDLTKSKYIIIDLRDCPGGIVSVLNPLIKYTYDGNSLSYVQGYTSPTKEEINKRKELFENKKDSYSQKDSLAIWLSIQKDEKFIDSFYVDKRTPLIFSKPFDTIK